MQQSSPSPSLQPANPVTWLRTTLEIMAADPCAPVSARAVVAAILTEARFKPGKTVTGGQTPFDFWIYNSQLERLSGLSTAAVKRAKKYLKDKGMLVLVRKGYDNGSKRAASVYRIVIPDKH